MFYLKTYNRMPMQSIYVYTHGSLRTQYGNIQFLFELLCIKT